MKLVILAIPVTDKPTIKYDAEGRKYRTFDPPQRQENWDSFVVDAHVLGREQNKNGIDYFLIDCLMNENFVTPVEEDLPDRPQTVLPTDWFIAAAWKLNNKGKTQYTYTPLPDIIVPAVDITDDVFTITKTYKHYYVKQQYDMTDPENPVFTGVYLYTRSGSRIVESVDNTDPDNPIYYYLFTDGVLTVSGDYIRTWTEPAKLVTHQGSGETLLVRPEDLEDDGTYIYKRYDKTVNVPAYEELVAKHSELIDWWNDLPEGGRPTVLSEVLQFGRNMESRF